MDGPVAAERGAGGSGSFVVVVVVVVVLLLAPAAVAAVAGRLRIRIVGAKQPRGEAKVEDRILCFVQRTGPFTGLGWGWGVGMTSVISVCVHFKMLGCQERSTFSTRL